MHMLKAIKPYHHGGLREGLLEVAEAQLEEEGPAGLCLRKLGRALGVTPGAPYRHFEDKGALLAALATLGFRRLRATMVDGQGQCVDGEKRLRLAGIGYLTFASKHPELFRLMFGWNPAREVPELREAGDAAFEAFSEVLCACEQQGLLQQGALPAGLLAWSAVHGAAFLMIDDRLGGCDVGKDPEAVLNSIHQSLWGGIGK